MVREGDRIVEIIDWRHKVMFKAAEEDELFAIDSLEFLIGSVLRCSTRASRLETLEGVEELLVDDMMGCLGFVLAHITLLSLDVLCMFHEGDDLLIGEEIRILVHPRGFSENFWHVGGA